MISKNIRKILLNNTDEGPTRQSLTHGSIDFKITSKRGPIMARKVGMHERLYARGKITDAEWNWACRYVVETEIAAGARLGRPECEPAEPWAGPLIYNRQCAAARFLRRAHQALNDQDKDVLIAACVDCLVLAQLGVLLTLYPKPHEDQTAYTNRISTRVNAACVRIIQQAAR